MTITMTTLSVSLWSSLVLLLLLATSATNVLFVQAGGIQSGPSSGALYAGGMVLDRSDNKLYLTGIHYNDKIVANTVSKLFAGNAPATKKSSCFVASTKLELLLHQEASDSTTGSSSSTTATTNPNNYYMFDGIGDWTSRVSNAFTFDQEACTALAVHKPSHLVVVGTKENPSADAPALAGNLAVYGRNDIQNKRLTEATLISQDNRMNQLIYPVAITPDKQFSDHMYVVVLASSDAQDNSAKFSSSSPYPDWLKRQKYGSSFEMHVSKIEISQGGGGDSNYDGIPTGSITATRQWTTEFPLDDNTSNQLRVFVGGIIHKTTNNDDEGLIIVVGSTRGTGVGYGLADGNDEDGFVTVLDPSTGKILGDGAREGSPKDDIVTGICDDPSDPEHFFIVGGTLGTIGRIQSDASKVPTPSQMLSPFLRQVKTDRSAFNDGDNLWTLQWAVTHGSGSNKPAYGSAIGCVVAGDYIYVAGTVDGGASVVQGDSAQTSQGGDDIWIAKVHKDAQQVEWMTQLGSAGNDRLARYGGITVDQAGNPILYGDTTGSLYRQRQQSESEDVVDIFLMTIDHNTGSVLKDKDEVNALPYIGGISSQTTEYDDDDDDDNFFDDSVNNEGDNSDGNGKGIPTNYPTYLTEFPTNKDGKTKDETGGGYPTDFPTYLTSFPTDKDGKTGHDDEIDDDAVPIPHFYRPIGLQISGPAYAGGIAYDSQENSVLLAGATYMDASMGLNPSSLCFTGVVDLETGNLKVRTPRGSKDLEEACNAISFDTNRNSVYAIGVAETGESGKFAAGTGGSAWIQADSNAKSGGLIFQMNENTQLLGGNHIVDYPTVYPVSIVTHPLDEDAVFVISMATNQTDRNENYNTDSDQKTTNWNSKTDYPNFLARDNRKYGSKFFLTIDRYKITDLPNKAAPEVLENDQVPNTIEKTWMVDYATTDNDNGLLVGGMIMAGNGNVLVVVGSTRGGGGPFETVAVNRNDMDGFVLKIDPKTGKMMEHSNGSKSSTRLDSVDMKDDWITNVCDDRFDHDSIYVVGKSMGKIRDIADDEQPPEGSTHAFVAKVNLKTLGASWLKHFTMTSTGGGKLEAEALACTVTSDVNGENIVYVGGTVQNGATVDGLLKGVYESKAPFGKDDIFVASMNGFTGEMNWIQQVGTAENDRLATGQGLDVDSFGNVIVYGETAGDFYDEHEGGTGAPDLVVFTMSKTEGGYLPPMTDGKGVGGDTPDEIAKFAGPNSDSTTAVAIQTDDNGIPSYAGGMHYDQFTNSVYLTGATYASGRNGKDISKTSRCIFAIATLPLFQWKQKDSLGTEKAPEACSSVSLASYKGSSEAIVVGSSESSGLLDNLRTVRRGNQYGMVLDLANREGKYELVGGAAVDEEKVQYPIKVITDNDKVFVVSMASMSDELRPEAQKASGKKFPNFTTGGITKFGSQYEILLERHTINRVDDIDKVPPKSVTMGLDWRKPLQTSDKKTIFVSGMAVIEEGKAMVVVGSTHGPEFGDHFDGIMAKISTNDGSFALEGEEARSVAYFSSLAGNDDWIMNICSDPDDDRYFYITGATGGQMDDSVNKGKDDLTVHAVVSMIQADTLKIIWTTQFGVTHASGTTNRQAASVALGCAKVRGKGHLYVAGDVENGAILNDAKTESAGGDDIFVAMLNATNGEKVWIEQAGSSGDDRIARGGGIAVDSNGNAVVYGDTTGDFHRNRGDDSSHTSDLFLMIFDHDDGAHQASVSNQSTDKTNNRNNPVDSDSTPSEWFVPNNKSKAKIIGIIIVVLFSLVLSICTAFLIGRRSTKRKDVIKKNSIFTYLQKFNVEDVDLRKSPAGGWHGTYLNKLAFGVNTNANLSHAPFRDEELDDDEDQKLFESADLVHSKVKKGSLFSNGSAPGFSGSYRDGDDEDEVASGLSTRKKLRKVENKFSIV